MDDYYRTDDYRTDAVPPGTEDPELWRRSMAALRHHHRDPDRPLWCADESCTDTGRYPCWAAQRMVGCMEDLLAPHHREAFRAWVARHFADNDPAREATP